MDLIEIVLGRVPLGRATSARVLGNLLEEILLQTNSPKQRAKQNCLRRFFPKEGFLRKRQNRSRNAACKRLLKGLLSSGIPNSGAVTGSLELHV